MSAILEPRRQSVSSGDLVLAVLPPFFHDTWLGAGVVRIAHLLAGNGIVPRVTRTFDSLDATPTPVEAAALGALALDIPFAERRDRHRVLAAAHADFFDEILEHLLAGPERLFLFSVWRTNVDVTVETCSRLRAKRPDAAIVLGGPEAVERGRELQGPWCDAVVSGSGEDVAVPLVRAFLDGRPGRARRLSHTWVSADHRDDLGPLASHRSVADIGPIDYEPLFPLVMADRQPRLPTVLNVGCVFNCGFCTNRLVYPEMGWGKIETCVDEVSRLGALWARAWPERGTRPRFGVELCDATINGYPEQFDELNRALAASGRPWDDGSGFELSANWVVDVRVRESTMEDAAAAGFSDLFFGLESGSDRVRKAMQKPGSADQVWRGLERANEGSAGRVHVGFGLIVGWPDETEQEHLDTLAYVERVASLTGLTPSANVSPLFRTPSAQDGDLLSGAEGDAYGVLWRSAEAAGDPGLRARRMMSYVERFRGIMRVDFPVPLEHLARWMMPPASHPFLERWLALQIDVAPSANAQAAASVVARRDDGNAPPPAFDPSEIAALFSLGGRRRDQVEVVVDTEKAEVRVLRDSGDVLLSFVVYRRGDEPRSCYRSTRRFEISLAGQRHTPEQLALADKILARVDRREQQHAS